jgi:hypothetical protein
MLPSRPVWVCYLHHWELRMEVAAQLPRNKSTDVWIAVLLWKSWWNLHSKPGRKQSSSQPEGRPQPHDSPHMWSKAVEAVVMSAQGGGPQGWKHEEPMWWTFQSTDAGAQTHMDQSEPLRALRVFTKTLLSGCDVHPGLRAHSQSPWTWSYNTGEFIRYAESHPKLVIQNLPWSTRFPSDLCERNSLRSTVWGD